MNISLPASLRAIVDRQVKERGYGTSSEYLRELVRKDRERWNLREMILEGPPRHRRNHRLLSEGSPVEHCGQVRRKAKTIGCVLSRYPGFGSLRRGTRYPISALFADPGLPVSDLLYRATGLR